MRMTISPSAPRATRRPPTADELAFVRARRIARLATVSKSGMPAIVPICYAVAGTDSETALVSALDEKPKSVPWQRLARVRHIQDNPHVAIVIDDYSEDWSRLAFVHLRGTARLVPPGEAQHTQAIAALREKYPQYQAMTIEQAPVIWISEIAATSWQGADATLQAASLGLPRPGDPADLAAIIQGRRSVRVFQERPVPRAAVERALAAAAWAPSPHGRQPWRFAVIERQESRIALADAMASAWEAQLRLDGQSEEIVQLRLQKSRERLTTAPVLVLACLYLGDLDVYPDPDRQAAETTMAIQSLGAAVQNLLLTIYTEGLDAGWMCAPLFCPEVVRTRLGLDEGLIPHALIAIGYAAKAPVRRPRHPLNEIVVQWE